MCPKNYKIYENSFLGFFYSMVIFSCCEGYGTMPGEPGCSVGKQLNFDLFLKFLESIKFLPWISPVKPLTSVFEGVSQLGAVILDGLLRATTLAETLSKEGPFTFFVPTNHAFYDVTQETFHQLNRTTTRVYESIKA